VTRIIAECAMKGVVFHRNVVGRWREKWKGLGWQFDISPKKKAMGYNSKLSQAGRAAVCRTSLGSNQRKVARGGGFESRGDPDVKVAISRQTVARINKAAGQQISEPKIVGIRTHFDHHRKMRVIHCKFIVRQPSVDGLWYADEQKWPITLSPNKKNDIFYVPAGQRSVTNIHRRTKADTTQCFSLFWTVCAGGVVCCHLYDQKMDVSFFHEVLHDYVAGRVERYRKNRSKFALKWFYHDHVTNSSDLFATDVMDEVFGEGRWLQHCPPICRDQDGFIDVAASSDGSRKAYKRKRMVPRADCECKVESDAIVASSSPELNIAESAQGYLRQLVVEDHLTGTVRWVGKKKDKMQIVRDKVVWLDKQKKYWRTLFDSVKPRAQEVIDSGGDLLKR